MPKRILLADDSITIQKVVELTFSDGDYEVIAVNNGAKAIQKLAEIRPDIVLSDIIMPEKNGYEVCEYVKSHPEYRTIPVVLLTGTFEPFDPDRADKAGCDAVVTKPFESQSLIQKVEELIQASQPAGAPAGEAQAPWAAPSAPAPDFGGAPAADPFASGQQQSDDVFGAAPAESSSADMPFETAGAEAFSGETRSFQRMSFEDLQKLAQAPPAALPSPPAAEAAPWDDAPQESAHAAPLPPVQMPEVSPWEDEHAASPSAAEQPLSAAPPPEASAPASSPWDEQPSYSGETRSFQRMNFDDLQRMASEQPPAQSEPAATPPPPPHEPESMPWETEPEVSGETRAMPRMSFEELQRMAAATPQPAAPRVDSPLWEEPSVPAAEVPTVPYEAPAPAGLAEPLPFVPTHVEAAPKLEGEPSVPGIPATPVTPVSEKPAVAATGAAGAGEMTDEQIERIARRVVEMMSAEVVRNIAWEVIPDMAEMVVKDRIRQLEGES